MPIRPVYRVQCSGPCRGWLSLPDGYQPGTDIPHAALTAKPTAARAGLWPSEQAARYAKHGAGWSGDRCPDCATAADYLSASAADLLRAAAVFVRLAADANTAIGENRPIPREMQGRTRAAVARADMHPAVGRALADWLEAMAGEVDGVDGEPWVDHAVAVARAVLGKGDPT